METTVNRQCHMNIDVTDVNKIAREKYYRNEVVINSKLNDVHMQTKIGFGFSGIVMRGSCNDSGSHKPIAIKIMIIQAHKMDDMAEEIMYSYEMGLDGVGPIVYDAYYSYMSNGLIVQVIIMEYFDHDALKFLQNCRVDMAVRVLEQMIILIDTQINNGLYCTDIKPANFVVKITEEDIVVKMIDFSLWCRKETHIDNYKFFQFLVFQLYFLIPEDLRFEAKVKALFLNNFTDDIFDIIDQNYNDDDTFTLKHYDEIMDLGIKDAMEEIYYQGSQDSGSNLGKLLLFELFG